MFLYHFYMMILKIIFFNKNNILTHLRANITLKNNRYNISKHPIFINK